MKSGFFLILSAYLVLIVFVGLRFSRRMKNLEDFFLASRSLSAFLVFMSLAASWFGATSILVTTDEAFRAGVSAFWLVGMPAVLTCVLFALVLARPIRQLPITTLPDLVEMRYGRTVRHLSSFLIIWYMIVLASSQMVAIGQFLKMFLSLPYFWSLLIGTAFVLLYSVLGGFLSVVATDCFQFLFLAAGVIGLFLFLASGASFHEMSLAALQMGRPDYFDFFLDVKKNVLVALSFTLAWTISPIAWQRIQAARSSQQARRGLGSAAGAFLLLYGLVVAIGMLALKVFASQDLHNPVVAELILSRTGFLLGGLVFVAVISAIMSTMDTAINTGALSLTRDVYEQVVRSDAEGRIIAASRYSTLIVGGLAFLVATRFQSILQTLGLASEIMAEGLFVPGMMMIFVKRKLPLAGLLSLLFGGGFALASFLCGMEVVRLPIPAWPSSVPYGVGLSLTGYMMGAALDIALRRR